MGKGDAGVRSVCQGPPQAFTSIFPTVHPAGNNSMFMYVGSPTCKKLGGGDGLALVFVLSSLIHNISTKL